MEVIPTRPTPELNHLIASALQGTRFKERRQREAGSDVQNQVVYFSPVIRIDPETQNVVIQYRDSETGAVTNEYPNLPEKVGAYLHAAQSTEPAMESEASVIPVISADTSAMEQVSLTTTSASLNEQA